MSDHTVEDPQAELRAELRVGLLRYLRVAREAVLWKLDGLSDYDVRRPLTPTGTNLLGLVKHLALVELAYLGQVFDRPSAEPLSWFDDDAEPNADMWATAEESRDDVVASYRRAWAHADATVEALPVDAVGRVPWWPEDDGRVTLHRILIHVIAETNRHAGHADILREGLDGEAGMRAGGSNLPEEDARWWADHRTRLEETAARFADS